MPSPLVEFTYYIAPDGTRYDFNVPASLGRWVLNQNGWGTPPIEYITTRAPFQDGETVKDFFLRPRLIQLFIRDNYCNRDDYWAGRAGLLDSIRPNRQTTPTAANPGQLVRRLSNGQLRALNVFISEGPRFEGSKPGFWDEFSYQEVLRFIAFDPVVFSTVSQTVAFVLAGFGELVFPAEFYESP